MPKAIKTSRLVIATALTLFSVLAAAQQEKEDIRLPEPKRFIDKVEIFAGPSLSFNYGNKFVENYKDENIQNKRLLKVGYTFGVGVYHPVSDHIDVNVRVQYEQKGRKTELNTPLADPEWRKVNLKDYAYNYLTLLLSLKASLGERRKYFFSLGVYYSKIKSIKGYEQIYDTQGQINSQGHYKGRFFEDLTSYGGIYSITWMPGLQSFEAFDLGAHVSLGYSIFIKKQQSLTIQLVDNLGFKNINKNNPYGLEEKNHVVSLIVGYILHRPQKK